MSGLGAAKLGTPLMKTLHSILRYQRIELFLEVTTMAVGGWMVMDYCKSHRQVCRQCMQDRNQYSEAQESKSHGDTV